MIHTTLGYTMRFWGILVGVLLLAGCDKFQSFLNQEAQEKSTITSEPIARVRNRFLYKDDLSDLLPSRVAPEDSANIVGRFVDSWIKRQLILMEAEKNLDLNQAELERRIQDYKYQLIVYEYEKKLVEEELSTEVSEDDIQKYYEQFPNSFELKQNIVKGVYLKIPKDVPRADNVKKWLSSSNPKDQEKLRAFAYSYADVAMLNDTVWIDFDELISNTPFVDQLPNRVQALKSNRILEASDSLYQYYVRVLDYKISDQLSPLEFVREQIKDILLNKRKVELVRDHENRVYEEAKRNEEYEIFNQ